MNEIPLPDLRFEQTFMKSLYGYAGRKYEEPEHVGQMGLTDEELLMLNNDIDAEEERIANEGELKPINPITPSIVIYAIIKDQIFMPFVQGLLWSGFLIFTRPVRQALIALGSRCGIWLYNILGLQYINRPKRPII